MFEKDLPTKEQRQRAELQYWRDAKKIIESGRQAPSPERWLESQQKAARVASSTALPRATREAEAAIQARVRDLAEVLFERASAEDPDLTFDDFQSNMAERIASAHKAAAEGSSYEMDSFREELEAHAPGLIEQTNFLRQRTETARADLAAHVSRALGPDVAKRLDLPPLTQEEQRRLQTSIDAAARDDNPAVAAARVLRAVQRVAPGALNQAVGDDFEKVQSLVSTLQPTGGLERDYTEEPLTPEEIRRERLAAVPLDNLDRAVKDAKRLNLPKADPGQREKDREAESLAAFRAETEELTPRVDAILGE